MAVSRRLTILAFALSTQPAATLGTGVLRGRSSGGRWQLLEALHLRSPQSPGPTSVPTGASPDAAHTGAEDATDATAVSSAATATKTTAPAAPPGLNQTEPSAQTAAPRFDAGVEQVDLEAHSARSEDTLVDSVELAQVGEVKRVVFRALAQLRAAQIKEFDTIAKLQTGAIDQFNDHFSFHNAYKVNYTMGEDTDEDLPLPVFLPGEEPWWSAPGGPDWTRQLDNATAEDRRGRPSYRKPKQGLPGQTADGAPCVCYPELLEVAAPSKDDPAGLALAAIRACCAGPDLVRRAGRTGI